MARSADYTIQGFLYQFNKTALVILDALDGDKITVEGVVEDIEVVSSASLKAIQCKYHEASTSFTPSAIYKPLLQMLKHFANNPSSKTTYILFAHFSGVGTPTPKVGEETLAAAMASTDKDLKKHIKELPSDIDLSAFVSRFTIEFGPTYDDITRQVGEKLAENGFPKGEIETLAYPNAIQMIATLSAKHRPSDRRITKAEFLSDLKAIRTTAISRWTLSLRSKEKLLSARRKQLKVHLDQNTRLRYFVIDPNGVEDFDTEIVLFVTDFIEKYHFKPAHIATPLFCLCADYSEIQEVQRRLFAKGVIANDGYVGGEFELPFFFREPLSSRVTGAKMKREFSLRILSWGDHGSVLNDRKSDDLFIIGGANCDALDTVDVNVERLSGVTFKEVKYVMGVSNVYE